MFFNWIGFWPLLIDPNCVFFFFIFLQFVKIKCNDFHFYKNRFTCLSELLSIIVFYRHE